MIKWINLGVFDDIATGLETASTTSHPSFQPLRAFEVVGRENVVFQDSYCTQGCFTLQFPNLRSSNPLKLSPFWAISRRPPRTDPIFKIHNQESNMVNSTDLHLSGSPRPSDYALATRNFLPRIILQGQDKQWAPRTRPESFRVGIGRLLIAISEEESPRHLSIINGGFLVLIQAWI